jgi:uncharacterized protein YwgA
MGLNKSIKYYVLLLLSANEDDPIRGKLFLQKEMFLIANEVDIEGDLKKLLRFEPYNFGPYSYPLELELRKLEKNRLIKTRNEGKTVLYMLSDEGKEYLNQIRNFDKDLLTKISKLKKGSERLGYKGLLRYVYFNYPEYIDKSKIKEEILGAN